MNFRIIMRIHAAYSKIKSTQKIDFNADGTQESHPTAWGLTCWCDPILTTYSRHVINVLIKNFCLTGDHGYFVFPFRRSLDVEFG